MLTTRLSVGSDDRIVPLLLFCTSLVCCKLVPISSFCEYKFPDDLLDIDDEEVEKQARYRFTEGRLEKATPASGFDVVLIGSGPGSMACAASLARIGKKCCVLEQGEQIGGGAHVFALKGYEFETGIHYLGNDPDMESMLDFATCGRLKLDDIGTLRADGSVVYDEVFIGDNKYDFMAGVDNFRNMMYDRFPSNRKEIDAYMARVEALMAPSYKQHAAWFFRLKAASFLPSWLRVFLQKLLGRKFWEMTQMTAEAFLCDCGVDPATELGSVLLGQYPDSGVRPDKLCAALYAGVVTHYINGSKYPAGGSGAIPRAMNTVVRAAGGVTFVQARVTSLDIQNGVCKGVEVNGSTKITADYVVSGIGAIQSYKMLEPHFPESCAAALARLRRDHEYSGAFIFLFVALDMKVQSMNERDNSSHNRWIFPRRGFTEMEKEIESNPAWTLPMPMFVASGSSKDSGWTSRFGTDKKTVVVLSQCPWSWVSEWADLTVAERAKSASYQAFKRKTAEELMQQGFRKVFPHLEKYVSFTEVGTPLTTNNYLSTAQGECYGMAATPAHWLATDLIPHTPCNNVYLTGQDIGTLGLAGSLSSGYLTANVIAGYGNLDRVLAGGEISTALGMKPIYG